MVVTFLQAIVFLCKDLESLQENGDIINLKHYLRKIDVCCY